MNATSTKRIPKAARPKRGRPPMGNRTMTTAERKSRSRRLAMGGSGRIFEVVVRGDLLKKIEEIADILKISPARALGLCAECGMGDMWLTALNVRDQIKRDEADPAEAARVLDEFEKSFQGPDPVTELNNSLQGVDSIGDLEKATKGGGSAD